MNRQVVLHAAIAIAAASSTAAFAHTAAPIDGPRSSVIAQSEGQSTGGHATHPGADYTKHQLDDARRKGSAGPSQRGNRSLDSHATHPGADYTKHQIDAAREGGASMGAGSFDRSDLDRWRDERPQTTGQAGVRSIGDGTQWP